MKVLSLTEPFATLITSKVKKIETRSWKTNYRGELYIHASKTKIRKIDKENTELMELIKDVPLNFGFIICKCKIIDCVCMTEDFIQEIKKNRPMEFICGDYKVGRYAWILNDIEILEDPIPVKGHLGIWNY